MIGEPMMKAMAIDPGDGIHIDAKGVVDDRDALREPVFEIKCAMSNDHMKHDGQVQPDDQPASDDISCAGQQALPGTEMRRSEIQARGSVEKKGEISERIIDPHSDLSRSIPRLILLAEQAKGRLYKNCRVTDRWGRIDTPGNQGR